MTLIMSVFHTLCVRYLTLLHCVYLTLKPFKVPEHPVSETNAVLGGDGQVYIMCGVINLSALCVSKSVY